MIDPTKDKRHALGVHCHDTSRFQPIGGPFKVGRTTCVPVILDYSLGTRSSPEFRFSDPGASWYYVRSLRITRATSSDCDVTRDCTVVLHGLHAYNNPFALPIYVHVRSSPNCCSLSECFAIRCYTRLPQSGLLQRIIKSPWRCKDFYGLI